MTNFWCKIFSMKNIIKNLFIFFALITALWLSPQNAANSELCDINYIQNDYQKIVLVSNSVHTGEIYTEENLDNSNGTLNSHNVSISMSSQDSFTKNSSENIQNFSNNLSNNIKNAINIRAP